MSRSVIAGFFASFMLAAFGFTPLAKAGFEFVSPPKAAQQQQQMQNPDSIAADASMPAAPMPEVTAEPLVPGPNEAIDTRGLLAATSQGRPVSLAPENQPMPRPAALAGANERLVINPYPLQRGGSGNLNSAALESAMTGGGNSLSEPQRQAASPSSSSGFMMPMPGGEGTPLRASDRVLPAADSVQSSSVPTPRAPDASPPQAASGNYEQAVGFGRDLPLALALSQVIPPQYTLSFGQAVDQGASVSWEGGKPWNVVLNEMLAPSGMKAVIANNQVTIVKAG